MLSCAAVPIRFATAACKPLCRSVAPSRPTCAQCWQWGQFRSMLRPSYFNGSFVKANSRYSLLHIFRTRSSKSAPNVIIFVTFWSANQTLATVLCAFCRPLSQIAAETQTLLRRPQEPPYL
jgi:hypothetical protein